MVLLDVDHIHKQIQPTMENNNNCQELPLPPMLESTPPRGVYPPKGFLDQSASMTSSTITYREKFTRRTDEKSATRRSISRNSKEKSTDGMDISKFYTKMTPKAEDMKVSPPRRGLINRTEDPQRHKKRSPTPLPGHAKKKEKEKTADTLAEQLQADLAICQLQKKIQGEEEEKKTLAKRVAVFEREIKVKLLRIQELQRSLAESQQRQNSTAKKLEEFQSLITINQNNLNQARNSLQKLKNTIKQNKYAQIQTDNAKLKQQNLSLKQEIQRMLVQAQTMKALTQSLSNSVMFLEKTNQDLANCQKLQEKTKEIQALHRAIQSSKSEREQSLEHLLDRRNRESEELRLKVEKLQMRLGFLNRKKCQEIDAVRDSKNEIINKLRKKVSSIFAINHSLRAQIEELKSKCIMKERNGRMSAAPPRKSFIQDSGGEQNFKLDLSP